MNFDILTDRQLIQWAIEYGGWKYFHSNDQLRDPQGGMTSTHNWEDLGQGRRQQIIADMQRYATPKQFQMLFDEARHCFLSTERCPVHGLAENDFAEDCQCFEYWALRQEVTEDAWEQDHTFSGCATAGGACAEPMWVVCKDA